MRPTATRIPLGKTATSSWIQLPCCDKTVHPVEILSRTPDAVVITAPKEPHPAWVKPPELEQIVTFGFGDTEGTTVLPCSVVADTKARQWTLLVKGAGQYLRRRKHVRAELVTKTVAFRDDDGRLVEGTVLDISESGMRAEFPVSFEVIPENAIVLTVCLDGVVLRLRSQPVWSGRTGPATVQVGFQIKDIHPRALERIRAYVDEWQSKAGEQLS